MAALLSAIGEWLVHKLVITNRIRELRFKVNEMTQQELADSVGITRQTVIALEQGKYYPSLELAFLIARTFDVAVEDVFQQQEQPR
jgi:putative transcriptional regulator